MDKKKHGYRRRSCPRHGPGNFLFFFPREAFGHCRGFPLRPSYGCHRSSLLWRQAEPRGRLVTSTEIPVIWRVAPLSREPRVFWSNNVKGQRRPLGNEGNRHRSESDFDPGGPEGGKLHPGLENQGLCWRPIRTVAWAGGLESRSNAELAEGPCRRGGVAVSPT